MTKAQREIAGRFPEKPSKTAEAGVRALRELELNRTPKERAAKNAELRERASRVAADVRR